MSFVFRGTRADIESGFHDFIPERRAVRFHGGGRPLNTNPVIIFITMFLLFMVLNSQPVSPNFLLWFGMAVFLITTSIRMYAMCQQIQAHANAAAVAATANGLIGHTELRLRMPPIAFATRGRLHGLRLQLALLDREFDELDYDALRALDPDNPPGVPALSEAEINSLPVHKYKPQKSQQGSSQQHQPQASSDPNKGSPSSSLGEKLEELTCSVCLEQVMEGEIVRTLPCLHQFHPHCIDQWLRQQATCPVCKFKMSTTN
ncbi:hypothetical protein SELMODRAFT_168691 [Selaginella moellendorffii]|uniref:RING-type E3 ubiquitin transferase n=1 Tax=Selaginella moellendorffii TaxID=88036 RepID=D8R7B1_SELML|nr:E3 ubiquitin-protein ligase SDIR1 [Selaginella moellendorffii]EFJ31493.1 hypothetical protein SELMODRAFT_168691 [Selaginella moellendorffii]|eukprot:XP_002966894.1 E3 ubiquitin-protein ligase SDIR1 [Selaginella moellendorffii]